MNPLFGITLAGHMPHFPANSQLIPKRSHAVATKMSCQNEQDILESNYNFANKLEIQ
jgi:hypothetical protein